jgi:hypothetical protein
MTSNLDAHSLKQKDEILDVQNLRDIGYPDLLLGKENCADYLQGLVLRSLRSDCTAELMPALYDK